MKDIHEATKPIQAEVVKNIDELIRLKKLETQRLQEEIEALEITRQVLMEGAAAMMHAATKEAASMPEKPAPAKFAAAQMLP